MRPQPPLFHDLQPLPLESAEEVATEPQPAYAPADDHQLQLFSDFAVLGRDLDLAVAAGDFSEASRLRAIGLQSFGPGTLEQEYAFVESLAVALGRDAPGPALEAWREVDAHLTRRPALRGHVRDGVFRRLLERHQPAALARPEPDVSGPLCAAMASIDPEGGRAAARILVRDLLLEGRALDVAAFRHDPATADLLGEPLSPVWLASLGVLRRLWPVPAVALSDSAGAQPLGTPPSDEAAAREFWACLCLARTPEAPEASVHEARRRMKTLSPDLHALFMRGGGGRSQAG